MVMHYLDEGNCRFLLRALSTGSNFLLVGPLLPWKALCSIPSLSLIFLSLILSLTFSSLAFSAMLACRRHCVVHDCVVRGCDTRIRLKKDCVTSCNAILARNQWQCRVVMEKVEFPALLLDRPGGSGMSPTSLGPAWRRAEG